MYLSKARRNYALKPSLILTITILTCLILSGCSSKTGGSPHTAAGQNGSSSSATNTSRQNTHLPKGTVKIGDLEKEISQTMPVIAIQTNSNSMDVMTFVNDTVARQVSENKATWTPDYIIPPEPYYEECVITVLDSNSQITLEDAEAEVKVRGNWTTDYPKKSLRIKFEKKHSLLGLNDGQEFRNWVLLAEYKDGSMLRDKTAFAISDAILGTDGLYCSDCELVSVVINGEYRGVYLLAEYQQLNEGRISGAKPAKDYTGTDIRYLLELDGYYYAEDKMNRFTIGYNDNAPLTPYDGAGGTDRKIRYLPVNRFDSKDTIGFTIKSDIYSQTQTDFIADFVDNTYKIMYEAAYNKTAYVFDEGYTKISKTDSITPKEAVERVVDLNSLADMYLISELTCDADIYYSSFYMSVDFTAEGNRKLTFQAPWDYDSAMGTKNRCIDGTGYYAANIVPDVNGGTDYGWNFDTINPWLAVLAYQDWFMDIVKTKWQQAYSEGVFDEALAMISDSTAKYEKEFSRNYDRWNNLADKSAFYGELSENARNCQTQSDAAAWLSKWLTLRIKFMNDVYGK